MIDLNKLYDRNIDKIELNEEYTIPSELITDERIKSLTPVKVKGFINLVQDDDLEEQIYISCNITGRMMLEDSISLEEIPYDFSIDYDDYLEENLKNNENRLDIFPFLWENIELEVPIKYTKEKDLEKFHGNNWRVVSEEEIESREPINENNPFKQLLDDYKKE
jgi:uncharacterized metal-binding protein YceD (DUF177 family)